MADESIPSQPPANPGGEGPVPPAAADAVNGPTIPSDAPPAPSPEMVPAAEVSAEAMPPAEPPPPPPPPAWVGYVAEAKIWVGWIWAVVEPMSIAVLFVYLLNKTWMRWPDALYDFPRELYTAWRLSEGDTLYVDVLSWYGPLPHLIEGAGFKLFGVGLDTLVWLNVTVTVITLLLLRAIVMRLANQFVAWACSIVFIVVFVFGQFVGIGNYNFMTPYASQATYGFAALLFFLWALLRHIDTGRARWLWAAGLGVGLAYVNKPEPLLAVGGALAVYLFASFLRTGREEGAEGGWGKALSLLARSLGWLAVGFFSAWGPVFLVLAAKGGAAYAWTYTNWVVVTLLTGPFVKTGVSSKFNAVTLGFDEPWDNFVLQAQAGGLLSLVFIALVVAAWVFAGRKKFGLNWWLALALIFELAWKVGRTVTVNSDNFYHPVPGTPRVPHFIWLDFGKALVFPVILLAFGTEIASLWAAWRRRENFSRVLGFAVVGTAAALMLARMLLNGRIYHYGFFMAPLAVCYLITALASASPLRVDGLRRANWPLQAAVALFVLLASVNLGQFAQEAYYDRKTLEVGSGRDRFYTFPFETTHFPNGWLLGNMIQLGEQLQAMKQKAGLPPVSSLIAFPESAAVNYHLRIRDPIPQVDFHNTIITFVGKDKMLDSLRAHPPEAIFIYMRDMNEYGVPFFGADEDSGLELMHWMRDNYGSAFPPPGTRLMNVPSPTGHPFDLLLPLNSPLYSPSAASRAR